MSNRTPSESDKEMAEGRTQRRALLLILAIVAAVGLVFVLCSQFQRRRAQASLEWPDVPGRIVTSEVTSHTDEDDTTYSADIEYVHTVEGVEHRSNVVALGGIRMARSRPSRFTRLAKPFGILRPGQGKPRGPETRDGIV